MKRFVNFITILTLLVIVFIGAYVRYSYNLERKIRAGFQTSNYIYDNNFRFILNDSIISSKSTQEADSFLLALFSIDNKYKFIELNNDSFKISNHFIDIKMKYAYRDNVLTFYKTSIKTIQKNYCDN